MISPFQLVDAIRFLTSRYGEPPNATDVAAQLGVTKRTVNRLISDMVTDGGPVQRVGRGDQTCLVVAESTSPEVQAEVQRLRLLSVGARAAVLRELAAMLGEVAHG